MIHKTDLSDAIWRKSSHSNGSGGNCVEVAGGVPRVVPVRDSKVTDGSVLVFSESGWATFVTAVKGGQFSV
jgi:hypothetical protein